jgi:ubiquinone/menaquinone biosynthesis C-methylase UbiE
MSEERRAAPAPNAVEAGAAEAADLDGDGLPPRPGPRDSTPAARRRGRMTLRIPDDEVARPTTESGPPPPVRSLSRPPSSPTISEAKPVSVIPMRIISIESDLPPAPDSFDPVSITPDEVSAEPPDLATTGKWTAATLSIEDGEEVEVVSHIQIDGAVSESEPPAVDSSEAMTVPALPSEPSTPRVSSAQVLHDAPAIAEETVDDAAVVADVTGEDLAAMNEVTGENVAAAAEATSEDLAAIAEETAEELAAAAEDEDVRFEDDALTPALPRVDVSAAAETERISDPGDAPEISPEDMVAEEAAPAPVRAPVELPPMRPRASSVNSFATPSQAPPPPVTVKPIPIPPTRPPLVIVPPHVGSMGPATNESIGPRRKGRLWWEDLFNDDYLRTMEKVTDEQIGHEVDFIETSLGLEKGSTMLDLACGTGRQAIELARRGYEVVAFDLSLQMLARAGDEAQEQDVKLNFVQGDMREMTFEAQFDGVYCWNTAFGYFDEEKNAVVVDRVHRALKPGGLFLLEVVNRDFIIRQSPSLAWFEGDGCVCMDEMTVDFITSRMKVKRTLMLDDGRSRETEYSMRIYSLHELGKILHEHGFKVTEVSGRLATPGVFFGNESPRTIILAEKR